MSADIGDFEIALGDTMGSLKLIEAQAAACRHLIALGGDHSITLPLLRALAGKQGPVGLIHFDAHVDTWPDTFGQKYGHGSVFYNAIEEGLVERSARLGEKLLDGLKDVQRRYPNIIKDVRGKGLLAGVEFDHEDFAALVISCCGRRDVLVAYSLNNPKVIRIEPPLIITEAELDRALNALGEAVVETAEMLEGIM